MCLDLRILGTAYKWPHKHADPQQHAVLYEYVILAPAGSPAAAAAAAAVITTAVVALANAIIPDCIHANAMAGHQNRASSSSTSSRTGGRGGGGGTSAAQQHPEMDGAPGAAEGGQRQQRLGAGALPRHRVAAYHLAPRARPCTYTLMSFTGHPPQPTGITAYC